MKTRTLLLMALLAFPLFAHGGGAHLRGVVSSVAADRIVVKTTDGALVEAKITPETLFVRGKAPVGWRDLKPGERVVVHARGHGKSLEAREVEAGVMQGPGKR